MSCRPRKKFARQNAKAALVQSGAINQYNEILDQQKLISEMGRYRDYAQNEYGFRANFIQYEDVNQSNKIVLNEAAFRAVDILRGVNTDPYQDAQTQRYLTEARSQTEELFDPEFDGFFDDLANGAIQVKNLGTLVTLKKKLLDRANQRLARIAPELRKNKDNEIKYSELVQLRKQLKDYIEGNPSRGIKGLEKEIAELEVTGLEKSPEILAPYIEKELQRLEGLVDSSDPSLNKEAADIIDYIISIGTFSPDLSHPLFNHEEIYDKRDFLLTESMEAPFREWKARAEKLKEALTAKGIEILTDTFNANDNIQKMFGREFTYEDIISRNNGLKDASWLDMMVMDVSAGIVSHNGLMPQVIRNMVDIQFEKQEAWAKELQNKIDTLSPATLKELRRLGYGLGKFGLKGVSFELFSQKFENGSDQKTGNIVDKYANSWFEDRGATMETFQQAFKDALAYLDPVVRNTKFVQAYAARNNWLRDNTKLINPALIASIVNNPAYTSLNSNFTYQPSDMAAHEQELRDLLGDSHYETVIAAQEEKLKQYIVQRKMAVDAELVKEGKPDFASLSQSAKDNIEYWESEHSPFAAVGYLDNNTPTMRHANFEFSSYVPRKQNSQGKDTNYYDANYDIIEKNPVLKEFYEAIYDATSSMKAKLPYEMQRKLLDTSLPNIKKNIVELMLDKDLTANQMLSEIFRRMLDYLKNLISINKQDQFVQGNLMDDYKVNDAFMTQNTGQIEKIFAIKKANFISAYNIEDERALVTINQARRLQGQPLLANVEMANMTKYKAIKSANITDEMARIISGYLGQRMSKQDLIDKYGENIPVGKIVYRSAQHEVASEKSFDLPKVIKLYTHLTAQYVARQEVLPAVELMKNHYQSIKNQRTQNTDAQYLDKNKNNEGLTRGLRTNANKQFDNWFERVVLGNYGLKKHYMVSDNLKTYSEEEKRFLKQIDAAIQRELSRINDKKVALGYNTISEEEAIRNGAFTESVQKLVEMKRKMGSEVALSAFVDSFMKGIRFKGLGFNFSSAITNFIEGQSANSIAAAQGIDFSEEDLHTVSPTEMMMSDMLKHTSRGSMSTKVAKLYYLAKQSDVLQDNTNELQKASSASSMTSMKLFDPFYLSKKPEHYNQLPLVAAVLKNEPITGENGEVSNVWDALEAHYDAASNQWTTSLKSEFATDENRQNWESFDGDQYRNWKLKISDIIKNTHGNLSDKAGMMAKSNHVGQMMLMYKSWLPTELYKRFGIEQTNITTRRGFKGRYRSFTPISGALHGFVAGSIFLSPVGGLVIGAATGFAVAKYFGGVSTGLTGLQELAMILKLQARKLIGMPVNLVGSLVGQNQLIKTNLPDAVYASMQKPGSPKSFTPMDFANFRGNMQEMSMMLTWFGLLMLAKGLFWDDDDKTTDPRRIAHNLLANRFFSLASSSTQYLNGYSLIQENFFSLAFVKFLEDTMQVAKAAQKAVQGEDTLLTGVNAGKSRLVQEISNSTVPGLFNSYGGFGKQMEREFKPQPWNSWFYGIEKESKNQIKEYKAEYKLDLIEQDKFTEDEIDKMVTKKFPRRKKGESYESKLKKIEADLEDDE